MCGAPMRGHKVEAPCCRQIMAICATGTPVACGPTLQPIYMGKVVFQIFTLKSRAMALDVSRTCGLLLPMAVARSHVKLPHGR
jgi:hypothetical protein